MPGLVQGQIVGSYRIEEKLGEGGFATVYRAFQPSLERMVAIKMLDDKLVHNPHFIQRFRQEVEATFSLQHPNIVRVYDFVENDPAYFMVMEFVDGPTLRDVMCEHGECDATRVDDEITRLHEQADDDLTILKGLTGQYRPLELGVIGQIGRDVLRGLQFAHQAGIIHRDVKPENVLLGRDGIVRLADFGIARVQEESRLTRTGFRIGTVAYMSPEQITDQKNLDGRSDLYSFGIMLYEMLTGSVPFVGKDTAVWTMHLRELPLPPSQLRPEIPRALEEIVLKCLAKTPADRFADAGQVITALESCVNMTPLEKVFDAPIRLEPESPAATTTRPLDPCPRCGFSFELPVSGGNCPICDQFVYAGQSKEEQTRRVRKVEEFIAGFNLPGNLSLEVRDYEYRRTLRPQLGKMIQALTDEWAGNVKFGAVISPVSRADQQPKELEILKNMRELFALAALLESKPMEAFIVAVETKRERRRLTASLQGMAVMLGGTLHSLRAAAAQNAEDMRSEYQAAKRLYGQAIGLVRDQNTELLQAARLSEALADMLIHFPQVKNLSAEVEQLARENASLPGRAASTDGDRQTVQEYRDSYQRCQQRLSDLRRKMETAIQRARQTILSSQSQFQAIQASIDQTRSEHLENLRRLDEEFAQWLVRLPKLKLLVQIAAQVGPLLLGLLVYYLSKGPSLGWNNTFTYIGLDVSYMPLIVTAGVTALGYCAVKMLKVKKLGMDDVLPLLVAIFGTVGMAFYWAGFGLYLNNLSYSGTVQTFIAICYIVLIIGIFYLINRYLQVNFGFTPAASASAAVSGDRLNDIKKLIENRRPHKRSRQGTWTPTLVVIGAIVVFLPVWAEIRAGLLAEGGGPGMPFLVWGRLLFLALGAGLGWSARKLDVRIQNFQQIKAGRLAELGKKNDETLEVYFSRRSGLKNQVNESVNRDLKEAEAALADLQAEADLLSRRLLRQSTPAELARSQELQQDMAKVRQELAKL